MTELKKLREALAQVKVDHLNKKIRLPLKTHAMVENALGRVLRKPKPLQVKFKRHRTPESVVRAFVLPALGKNGKLSDIEFGGGYLHDGSEAPNWDSADMVQAIREMGLWGFAATKSKPPVIHYWTDGKRPLGEVVAFLGHELGHCTGASLDDVEEEWRADTYAEVAVLVLRELRKLR